MAAAIWTLICMAGLVIWAGITVESWYYWRSLGREDPVLASSYLRQLLGDSTICTVLGLWTLVGALALIAPGADGIASIAILIGLYSGPVGLLLFGLWRYWRRRGQR